MPEEYEDSLCPLRHIVDTFGGKWKMPIICILSGSNEPQRYSVIKRRLVNITNMMLSQSLHELEASGIIHRKQYNEIPPHVEYSLTEKGRSTLPFIIEAAKWAVSDMQKEGLHIFCDKCVTIR